MGQKHGKAIYHEDAKPFLNLSFAAVGTLWETFNDVADGFGITLYEFREICGELAEELQLNRAKLDKRSAALFELLDTDRNGLIDAIEFISAMACASGMSVTDTLRFVLECYDFDETGRLTIDEVTLAFKSTATGMCKLEGAKGSKSCPRDADFQAAAIDAFERRVGSDQFKIKIQEVVLFCLEQPKIRSWLDYFDDSAEEVAADLDDGVRIASAGDDRDVVREARFPERTPRETSVAEDDAFSFCGQLPKAEARTKPPWMETVDSLVPTDLRGKTTDRSPPDIGASLQWIHGYASVTCRNNVRYSAVGQVIYPACRACVSYNFTDHRQRYNMDHTDDICSFALHPSGKFAASGEVGTAPKIIVWETATMQTVKILKGFHQRAVSLLAFSENGSLLASVGQDDNHCLAVYDWEKGSLQHTGPSDTRAVLGCCFEADGGVVTCGEGHALFWKKENQFLLKQKGIFGRKASAQTLLSCCRLEGKVVTGTASGHLYVWFGRNCVRSIRGHYGSVTAMYSGPYGLISGGKDMRIRFWSPKMEAGATFDMSAFGPCPVVQSVCLSSDGTKLLVGVKGCEIYEISAADGSDMAGGPITTSHFEGELTGLARHPQRAEFATAGGDGTVRIWDANTRSLLRMMRLDSPASCIDYSPDGELLVVGFGHQKGRWKTVEPLSSNASNDEDLKLEGKRGRSGSRGGNSHIEDDSSTKNGGFIVLNQADFVTTSEARDAKKAILEARWSPDRETVVLGGEDTKLYIYSTVDHFELVATAEKHKHPVTAVDFSKDGDWIRSNCKGGRLCIWDVNKGKHQTDFAKFSDVEWSTETCVFTWATRGIFSETDDEIICVDRSPNGLVIAAGDRYSRIRLYRHPCPLEPPTPVLFHELKGHGAGGVSRARFLRGGRFLVTIGAVDRCILQWELNGACAYEDAREGLLDTAKTMPEEESDGYVLDMRDGSDFDRASDFETAAEERRAPISRGATKTSRADTAPTNGWKESGLPPPPEPWEQTTVAPSRPPPNDKNPPADGLELERINGYRGRDSRNNAAYAGQGDDRVVFTTAAAGVSLDLKNHTQVFHLGHPGDVISLAVSPDGLRVATGEISRRPSIIVWEMASGEAVQTLSGFLKRAVTALSFSPNGRYLASAGCDDSHSIAIYDWSNRLLTATAKGGHQKALGIAWNEDGTRILTCGLRHVSFWALSGRNLSHCRGVLGSKGRKQTFPCCAFVKNTAVVGTGDGHLYVFENGVTTLTRSIKAHIGSVYAIHAVSSPGAHSNASTSRVKGLWTGGKDGLVKFFDEQISELKEFSVATIASNGAAGGAAGALKALAGAAGAIGGASNTGSIRGRKRKSGSGSTSISLDPAVRSVFASRDGLRLLVGTRGGELYEMSTTDGSDAAGGGRGGEVGGIGPLTAGHGRGQVWGLSAHPQERLYATCGDDGTVRIWSLDDWRMVESISTDCSCRALCYSPDGASLVVGCGGGHGKSDASKSGTFLVLKSENLALTHEAKDADDWIRDINYSKDGARLAVTSNDCKIYVYATRDDFAKLSVVSSHQSIVTQVDFSVDGNFLQSVDGARSLLFAEAATGVNIPSAASMKDMDWGTLSLPFGWAVRGIWPTAGDNPGTEVTCVKRSDENSLLAAGDNFGRLRLFKFPAPTEGSCYSEYRGHCAPIRRICWSAGGTHALSCGEDGSVMQWRRIPEPDVVDSGDEAHRSGEDSELEGDCGIHCCQGTPSTAGSTLITSSYHEHKNDGDVGMGVKTRGEDTVDGGDVGPSANGGVKAKMPWVTAMVPPSNVKNSDTTAPEIRLRLEAVHGCRAGDVRGCVWYNHEQGIVYPSAALGVIYDPRMGQQSYHMGHSGDIISLTVSSCRRFAASGDAANPPRIHVWDAVTGAGFVSEAGGDGSGLLPSLHRVGVALLAFSQDGHWLASVGHDPAHTVAVYKSPSGQWVDAFPVATAKAGFTRFLCLVFTGQDSFPLMVGGIKAVTFFDHTGGSRGLRRKTGVFGLRKKIQPILCGVKMLEDQMVLTGTVTGHLYIWKAHRVHRTYPGHAGPVYACAKAGVKGFVTAGKDGFVRLWDVELQKLKQYGLFEAHPASTVLHSTCAVRSACKLLVCTRAGEIFEVSRDSGHLLLLAEGHGKKLLMGLETHPIDPDVYATVGDDAFVRIWSISLKRASLKMKVDSAARSLAYSPSGHHLAVGLGGDSDAMVKEGAIIILSGGTLEVVDEVRSAKTWITDMKYSDDGSLLAVASAEGKIYVHDAMNHYSLKASTDKLEDDSAVTNIDFSADNKVLQATTSSKDLIFFRVNDGKKITANREIQDISFQTQTCPMGWTVQAAWSQAQSDLQPVSMDRCAPSDVSGSVQHGPLLAVGYETGGLRIFRYPCQNQGAQSVSAIGHSTSAGRVRFNADGTALLSIGPESRVVLQHALLHAPLTPT